MKGFAEHPALADLLVVRHLELRHDQAPPLQAADLDGRGDLHWLEWSVPDDAELDDLQAVKRANPAPWITLSDLRRRRAAIPETAFAQFHACRWGVGEGSWLPPAAWQACVGEPDFADGEDVWIDHVRALAGRFNVRDPWRANIDATIALAMAVERAEHVPEPVELVGWL